MPLRDVYVGGLAGFDSFLAKFLGKFIVVAVDSSLLKLKERTDALLEEFGGVKIQT